VTEILNESGLSRLQKIQFDIASGAKSIIEGLGRSAFIKYYTDYIGMFFFSKYPLNKETEDWADVPWSERGLYVTFAGAHRVWPAWAVPTEWASGFVARLPTL